MARFPYSLILDHAYNFVGLVLFYGDLTTLLYNNTKNHELTHHNTSQQSNSQSSCSFSTELPNYRDCINSISNEQTTETLCHLLRETAIVKLCFKWHPNSSKYATVKPPPNHFSRHAITLCRNLFLTRTDLQRSFRSSKVCVPPFVVAYIFLKVLVPKQTLYHVIFPALFGGCKVLIHLLICSIVCATSLGVF